jgi:hypothetical protein
VYDSSNAHAAEIDSQGLTSARGRAQATALLESVDSDEPWDRRVMVPVHASRDLEQLDGVLITTSFQNIGSIETRSP